MKNFLLLAALLLSLVPCSLSAQDAFSFPDLALYCDKGLDAGKAELGIDWNHGKLFTKAVSEDGLNCTYTLTLDNGFKAGAWMFGGTEGVNGNPQNLNIWFGGVSCITDNNATFNASYKAGGWATATMTKKAPVTITLTATEASFAENGTIAGTVTVGESQGGEDPVLKTLTLTPDKTVVEIGGTVNLSVAGKDQYGKDIAVENVTYSFLPQDAGTLSGTVFTAAKAGEVTFTATSGDITANVNVLVYKSFELTAAPEPQHDAAKVISIFSDKYGNAANLNTNCAWNQATVSTVENVDGNSTGKLAGLNYQGWEFDKINIQSKDFIHFDVLPQSATSISFVPIFKVSENGGNDTEKPYKLVDLVPNEWNSIDMPLTAFATDRDGDWWYQIKFDNGDGKTFYVDNIYAWESDATVQFTWDNTEAKLEAPVATLTWGEGNSAELALTHIEGTNRWSYMASPEGVVADDASLRLKINGATYKYYRGVTYPLTIAPAIRYSVVDYMEAPKDKGVVDYEIYLTDGISDVTGDETANGGMKLVENSALVWLETDNGGDYNPKEGDTGDGTSAGDLVGDKATPKSLSGRLTFNFKGDKDDVKVWLKSSVKIESEENAKTIPDQVFTVYRGTDGELRNYQNIHFSSWEGVLLPHNDVKFTFDGLNSAKDPDYLYWYLDCEKGKYESGFVTQCNIYIDGAMMRFDVRDARTWNDITALDALYGNARLRFGIDPVRIWVRGKKEGYTSEYDRYEIYFAVLSRNFEDISPATERPVDYSTYTISVPAGTPLYQLMKGTLADGSDLTLTLQKKVSNEGYYQINLGRKVKFDVEQPFTFHVDYRSNGNDDEYMGRKFNEFQFDLTENSAAYVTDNTYIGTESHKAAVSHIAAGVEFDRIILYIKGAEGDNTIYPDNTKRYWMQLSNGRETLPYYKEGMATLHTFPFFKGWSNGDVNAANSSLGILTRSGSETVVAGGMPKFDASSGATAYWQFHHVDKTGKIIDDDDTTTPYHPNVFYIDFPQGVNFSPDFNAAAEGAVIKEGNGVNNPTSFNIIDEDGYDAANPMQGGQVFYPNTWWCVNPRVVPDDYVKDGLKQNWRQRYGTPGDLFYASTAAGQKVYGITAFRITAKKYDMYAPAGHEICDGNIWYLYFNTNPPADGVEGRAELTAPILINMLGGKDLELDDPNATFYEPKDYVMGDKMYNVPVFVPNGCTTGVKGSATAAAVQKPVMLTLDDISANGEAVYRLKLNNYRPGVENPFEIASVTNSIYWAPTFSAPENDKLRPAHWTRFYRGSSRANRKIIRYEGTEPVYEGNAVDHTNSQVYLVDPDQNYDRFVMMTTSDNVRYMLHANVPEVIPTVEDEYVKHSVGKTSDQYPDLIYPNVNLRVEVAAAGPDIMNSVDGSVYPMVVGVYIQPDGSETIHRYFYEYLLDKDKLTLDENGRPTPTTGNGSQFSAGVRRVYIKYDEEKNQILLDGNNKIIYTDEQGNDLTTDAAKDEAYGDYKSCNVDFSNEKEDDILETNEVLLKFDYDYSFDPDKAKVRTGSFIGNNLAKNMTIHTLDYNPSSQTVSLEVPGNNMDPWKGDSELINLEGGAYTTTVKFGATSDNNELPRVYTLYEYDPQSPAWKALCADKLSGLCDGNGVIIPGNEETVLDLVKEDKEEYEAYGQHLSRPVMQEVLVVDENNLNGTKVDEGEFTRITNHGTPLVLSPLYDENATGAKEADAYLGFVVKMTYTYAYPEGNKPIIKNEPGTAVEPASAPRKAPLDAVDNRYINLAEGYVKKESHSYASDYAYTHVTGLTDETTVIETITSGNMKVTTAPGRITVTGADGDCMIFNLSGVKVYAGAEGTVEVPSGVYIVTSPCGTAKVMVP